MRRYAKKQSLSISKVFELIGKPAFFLFTIFVIGFASYLHLLKLFVQQVGGFFSHLSPRTLLKRKTWLRAKLGSAAAERRVLKVSRRILFFISGALVCLAVSLLFYYYILRELPSASVLSDSPPSQTTRIYDRHGTLLYQIYKDENRSLIHLQDLPPHVIQATLAAEDKNFYHHWGIDLVGILRATFNNLSCRLQFAQCNSLQGGSTITQQLVKNTLLTPEKTFTRKVKELVLSLQVERLYSKDQILEMYFNQIGYGGTAYGIEQASRQYFGVAATELNLAQSAMLAGLPISPTLLSPFGTNPYLGKIRQHQVLESMVASKMISENDKVAALNHPLVFHPQGIEIRAPHFVMYVKELLVQQFGEAMVARGGLSVTTTLDLSYQDILQSEINTELDKLKALHVQNGAGLVVDPQSGEILAMVGSHDFFDSKNDGQVNIVVQPRQPGSSIKPITYALALSRGLTPNSRIDDAPICFIIQGQPNYCPKNYDGRFHGSVTLRTALASSYNIPAIKLLNAYGVDNMVDLAKTLGITTWDDSSRFGLSLTLGGGEITMLDLASAYSVFANGGTKVPFTSIISVVDSRGVSLTGDLAEGQVGTPKVEGDSPKDKEVLSPAIAYQINSILSDPLARAPAFGINSILGLPGKNVAVKTGTTNNLRDNWTFGYTPNILVATWVGNNDNTPMSSVASGITGASPIWARTMSRLLKEFPSTGFAAPESLVKVNVSCTSVPRYEYFVEGSAPKPNCNQKTGDIGETGAATTSQ